MRKLITAILMGARHLLALLENDGFDTASSSNRCYAGIALAMFAHLSGPTIDVAGSP